MADISSSVPEEESAVGTTEKPQEAKRNDLELEARTKAVEKALGPLIEQITDVSRLDETRQPSPPIEKLIHALQNASQAFVSIGEQIASENSSFQEDLLLACDEVKVAGESTQQAALEFSHDSMDSEKRETMAAACHHLLKAVTRLMVVVDVVDTQKFIHTSNKIEVKMKGLYDVTNEADLMKIIRDCTPDITRLTQLAAHTFNEESNETRQQLLAAAQTQLNQASCCLITSSKTFLHYPMMESAQGNRDYIISSMIEALETITDLTEGKEPSSTSFFQAVEEGTNSSLYQYFDEFEDLIGSSLSVDSSDYPTHQHQLEDVLHRLLNEAGSVLSLSFLHDYRQHSIITLSSTLKHKMEKLFRVLKGSVQDGGEEREKVKVKVISERVEEVKKTAQDLKLQLTNAVMDQLSGAFLQPLTPVERVETAAKAGKETSLWKRLTSFNKHATDMEKAAQLVCSLSLDSYGVRTTQFVLKYISSLKPQVAYAVQTLCSHPLCHLSLRNMVLFREAWTENIQLLLSSVEALTPLTQFMTVVEVLVREDSQRFMKSIEGGDGREVKRTLQAVKGRCLQLLRMVRDDVAGNEERYSEEQLPGIKSSAQTLKEKSLPWFTDLGSKAADTLVSTRNPHTVNRAALEEAAQKVNEDVWSLRRAVLIARGECDGDIDSEVPTPGALSPYTLSQESILSLGGNISPEGVGKFERTPRYSGVFQQASEETQNGGLASLSSGQREKLTRETESLSQEHSRFEREVTRWSDSGHDIIIIAKEMCNMMLDMSEFTKGEGQLQTAMDVIVTAKDIARAGEYLYLVTKPLAEKCPNAQHRDDLLVYLDRMRLHTQQLKITSAVTLEHEQQASGDTKVDTASAMLSAGKSLMNTVVLVVKICYLASSAIARAEGKVPEEVVQWRLESPKPRQLTPEPKDPPTNSDRDTAHTYKEKTQPYTSPSSQLEEFRAEGDGKETRGRKTGVAGGGKRGRKVTPVPSQPLRGQGMGIRHRKGKGAAGELEAIPEVVSSHSLHETTFL